MHLPFTPKKERRSEINWRKLIFFACSKVRHSRREIITTFGEERKREDSSEINGVEGNSKVERGRP